VTSVIAVVKLSVVKSSSLRPRRIGEPSLLATNPE
jgi:hypothetical protein